MPFYMKIDAYHQSLLPLEEACRLAQSRWICLPNPLVGWGCEGTLCWKAGVLLRHFALVLHCWRTASDQHILVREFSTIPLLIAFPLLWPLRCRLLFFIHHNLQWAARSPVENFAFRLLTRCGAQWAVYEVQPNSATVSLELPHPVPRRVVGDKSAGRPVIGVAGYYRPEKGMDELLLLLKKHFSDCDILAGVPNPEAVRIPSVKVINTITEADYRAMLARCDVLVQNNARDSYFYRASGPVADAAASGTAVVVPDYPLMRHQVLYPVPVGEVFQTLEEMPDAVRRAVDRARAGKYDFDAYCAARSAQAVADQLDEFSRRQDG